jgi:tRNA-splicing ligase RtcB
MVRKDEMTQVNPLLYEISTGFRQDMQVPARVYASEDILELALEDRSLEQLVNTTTLPGVVGYTLAMPDIHQGYGFPIGGVAATELPDGVISPGGVGYDINCGVRVLTSSIDAKALRPHMDKLMSSLSSRISAGVGASGNLSLSSRELPKVLEEGAQWAVRNGYGTKRDAEHTEDGGRIEAANASSVSERALERGATQLGTLGAGNHFLEVDEIVEVYDDQVAKAFDLVPGRACVWIHCGSRGFGHQVCTDAVRTMQRTVQKYGISLPDRELACAPFDSPEGRSYFEAMNCAANYAWANRQVITHLVRESFENILYGQGLNLELRML